MNDDQIGHTLRRIAITGLALLLAACSTTPKMTPPQDLDAEPHWPGLLGDVTLDADELDFRHRIRVTGIDEAPILDGALHDATAHCQTGNCRVSPGRHRLSITYEWSSTKTRGDERAENFLSALMFATLLMGGGGTGGADHHADPGILACSATLDVPFSAGRHYRLSVSHASQRSAPERLGIVDIESGEYLADTESCRPATIAGESL